MSKGLKTFVAYSAVVLVLSVSYYGYLSLSYPASPERETFLTEVGEGIGEVASTPSSALSVSVRCCFCIRAL